jgi:biotin carboxyl carrier protein
VSAERIGAGRYRVVHQGRSETVFVAGPPGRRWAYWNGQVFREETLAPPPGAARGQRHGGVQQITAPMPATVLKVLAEPGARVTRGDTLIIVEAMKMELPLRASDDAVVVAVRCREGEIVQPDAVLVELE